MRRSIPKINKILACVLALMLLVTSSVGVYAEDESGSASGENFSIASTNEEKSEETSEEITGATNEDGEEKVSEGGAQVTIPEEEVAKAGGTTADGTSDSDGKNDQAAEDEKNDPSKDGASEEGDKDKKDGADDESDGEDGEDDEDGEDEEDEEDEEGLKKGAKKKVQAAFTTEPITVDGMSISASVDKDVFDAESVEFKAEPIGADLMKTITDNIEREVASRQTISNLKIKGANLYFTAGGEKINPKDDKKVKITVSDIGFEPKMVIHVAGEGGESLSFDYADGKTTFWADSFSPYIFASYESTAEHITLSEERLYGCPKNQIGETGAPKQSAYGYATLDKKHADKIYTQSQVPEGHYALRVRTVPDGKVDAPIAPESESDNEYFVYEATEGGKFTLTMEAPVNYYFKEVYLKGRGEKIYEHSGDEYTASTSISKEITLKPMDADHSVVNVLLVKLEQIPNSWDKDGKTEDIGGVTLINYKDLRTAGGVNYMEKFGDSFHFNHGNESDPRNCCNYRQVYQGLASEIYDDNGFKLAAENNNPVFAESGEYVKSYKSNVAVRFTKVGEYWTIDSSQARYEIRTEDGKDVLMPLKNGEKSFRPFGTDNHFGMILPITFSVSNGGKNDNGEDTVFKFTGDDDVFVYIDGDLVLDLGGIHNAIRGEINFNTGEILIQSDHQNILSSSVDESCYKNKVLGAPNVYSIVGSKDEFLNREHKLTVVYFERGANRSNCRISFNFNKEEQIDTEFSGFKRNADDTAPVEGAEFTLYSDKACTTVVKIGDADAVTTSTSDGTIKFANLSVGIIKNNSTDEISKTYYMKETKAAEGFLTPVNAVWKLVVSAQKNGDKITTNQKLTAETPEAESISISAENVPVARIKNEDAKPVKGNYEGHKVAAEKTDKKLDGAEFTLFSDEACTTPVKVKKGEEEVNVVAVSDKEGLFKFEDIELVTYKTTDPDETIGTKTFYVKETKAPKGRKLRPDARWSLTFKPDKRALSAVGELKPITEDARAISVKEDDIVKYIVNEQKAPGKLNIVKTLKNYQEKLGTAVTVFEVKYTDLEGNEHSCNYEYNFNASGTKDSIELEFPADVEVQVFENYPGASYKLESVTTEDGTVSNNIATITIPEDDKATVTFVNKYDGRINYGSISIKNEFKKNADKLYEFFKKVFGGEQ